MLTATGRPVARASQKSNVARPVVPPANVVVVRTCTQPTAAPETLHSSRPTTRPRPRSVPAPVVQPTVNVEPGSSPAGRNSVSAHGYVVWSPIPKKVCRSSLTLCVQPPEPMQTRQIVLRPFSTSQRSLTPQGSAVTVIVDVFGYRWVAPPSASVRSNPSVS